MLSKQITYWYELIVAKYTLISIRKIFFESLNIKWVLSGEIKINANVMGSLPWREALYTRYVICDGAKN